MASPRGANVLFGARLTGWYIEMAEQRPGAWDPVPKHFVKSAR